MARGLWRVWLALDADARCSAPFVSPARSGLLLDLTLQTTQPAHPRGEDATVPELKWLRVQFNEECRCSCGQHYGDARLGNIRQVRKRCHVTTALPIKLPPASGKIANQVLSINRIGDGIQRFHTIQMDKLGYSDRPVNTNTPSRRHRACAKVRSRRSPQSGRGTRAAACALGLLRGKPKTEFKAVAHPPCAP